MQDITRVVFPLWLNKGVQLINYIGRGGAVCCSWSGVAAWPGWLQLQHHEHSCAISIQNAFIVPATQNILYSKV